MSLAVLIAVGCDSCEAWAYVRGAVGMGFVGDIYPTCNLPAGWTDAGTVMMLGCIAAAWGCAAFVAGVVVALAGIGVRTCLP